MIIPGKICKAKRMGLACGRKVEQRHTLRFHLARLHKLTLEGVQPLTRSVVSCDIHPHLSPSSTIHPLRAHADEQLTAFTLRCAATLKETSRI